MALTRDFRETVQARVRHDAGFRKGLLRDAVESLLAGEVALGKDLLRDYINATVGFPKLAKDTRLHVKSLHQDVRPQGKSYRQQFIRNRGLPTTARRGSLAGPHQPGSSVRRGGNGFLPPCLSATMGHPPLRVKIVPTLRQAQGRLLSPKDGDKSGAPMGKSDA